jgi:hypothetical protein
VDGGASFTINSQLASDVDSSAPTTVGIVTWSFDGEAVSDAVIDFGLDTSYGLQAPVDLAETDYRTLLLGMKPNSRYHFRIVATAGGTSHASDDYTIDTKALPSSTPVQSFEIRDQTSYQRGFIIFTFWQGPGSQTAYIIDADGDIVWWYTPGINGMGRAVMSADGKTMWMITASNSGAPLHRVTMDGLNPQTLSNAVGSHDIFPVEGSTMVYLDYGESDCNSAFEIDDSGTTKEVFELSDYVSGGGVGGLGLACHGNSVRYDRDSDMYVVSSLNDDVFIFPRSGGPPTRLSQLVSGGNASWGGTQHGTYLRSDSILIFANDEGSATGGFSSGGPSTILEFSLANGQELWRYESSDYTANLGDVQRLPGGNTLVTFGNASIVRQIDSQQETVMQFTAGSSSFGYAQWRPSLYGPPPGVY